MKLRVEVMAISFDNRRILEHVGFHVEEGEFTALIGPSGCGKSTLLNILAGLLDCEEGTFYVDDVQVSGVSSHFAYMPQDDLLLPWKNILDNVCLYGKLHGHVKEAREQALQEFEAFGLKGYEQAYPYELSGGMRQRAAFLRTALCSADILLLDEPFGALDVITRNDMQDWLLKLRSELNRTMLLVTHDIEEALYLADRILILSGSPASICREISLKDYKKSREWLYDQGGLKKEIYQLLKEGTHDR